MLETILIIDDDGNLLRLAQLVLERAGYTVLTARSAVDGLRCQLGVCFQTVFKPPY